MYIINIIGIDVAMVGGHREVEEGSNLTFVCTTYNVTRLTSEPFWRYGAKVEKLRKLSKPQRVARGTASTRRSSGFKISHGLYMNEFHRSTLQLFNVTRRLDHYYFECTDVVDVYDKRNPNRQVAIRFRGITNYYSVIETQLYNIHLKAS